MRAHVLLLGLAFFGCSDSNPLREIRLSNPTDQPRKEVVSLDISEWQIDSPDNISIETDGNALNFEQVDANGDDVIEQIRLLVAFDANESKVLQVMNTNTSNDQKPEKLTQAEISVKKGGEWQDRKYIGGEFENVESLSVPEEHTDHSSYIRYEGPGWESNLVGYRFYLDWRNGVDIFGKKTNEMVLQDVGLDNMDSYHEDADWGMDILKVGNSLGLGSIGRHLNDSLYRFQNVDSVFCQIAENGLLRSSVVTKYYNWQTEDQATDLTSSISIEGESRLTKHELNLSNPISGICTGVAINEGEAFIDISEGDYRLLATYGRFSLNDDHLGMGIIVRKDQVDAVFDDKYSHVVTFKPLEKVTYYFFAAWEKEPDGIQSLDAFRQYVREELIRLNNPIAIETVN